LCVTYKAKEKTEEMLSYRKKEKNQPLPCEVDYKTVYYRWNRMRSVTKLEVKYYTHGEPFKQQENISLFKFEKRNI